jgi:glutathione S-transferase
MRAQGMSLETAKSLGLYRLYGSEMSMFTAKVRPVFRRKGLRWVEQLATQERWQEAEDLTGNRMIPIVFTPDGECVQDSSVIIDLLETRHPEIPVESPDPVLKLLGRIFELYHDELMPLLAVYFRWIQPDAIEQGKARAVAMSGQPEMAEAARRMIGGYAPMLGIDERTIPAIERHYEELLDTLEAHLATSPFLLGDVPSLADFSICGTAHAHLYLDHVPHRIMWQRAPRVTHWIMRVDSADPFTAGDWLDAAGSCASLRELLRITGRAAAPYVGDTVRALRDPLRDVAPGAPLPRAVGGHATHVCGVAAMRVTTPYTLFMLQRVQDVHETLDAGARATAAALLEGTGWDEVIAERVPERVALERHRLVRSA